MEEVISTLIGFAGACENGGRTERTDRVLLDALAVLGAPDPDGKTARATAEAVRREKFAVSPGCATCPMPCGNTSDFDMSALLREPEAQQKLKREILNALCETARALKSARQRADIRALYKALISMRYSLEETVLRGLLEEIRSLGKNSGKDGDK